MSSINIEKGSPNRMLLVLGVLSLQKGSVRQKELAETLGWPVSSVVDLIKKANQVEGMSISSDAGEYIVTQWSSVYRKSDLGELFKEYKKEK